MKKRLMLPLLSVILCSLSIAQAPPPFQKLAFLFGHWQGIGTGFGNTTSTVNSEFQLIMKGSYIAVKNDALFEPTNSNPDGEHHVDQGIISFDKQRKCIVYREFNIEGFVNQYVLIDSLSSDSTFVFETESIENFVPGGKARWTLRRTGKDTFETAFDLAMPGKPFSCYGTHRMSRREQE